MRRIGQFASVAGGSSRKIAHDMIPADARKRLAEYLRFQRDLGMDLVDLPTTLASAEPVRPAGPLASGPAAPGQRGVNALSERLFDASAIAATVATGVNAPRGADPNAGADPEEALRVIREDLGECTRCELHRLGRRQIVFGVGNPRAELVFVGEAPGADEDVQGIPFVGRAGQLLTDMIEKGMRLRRSDVYICNVIKCRPPGNRTPEQEECATCRPFLYRQLAAIRPRMICALGSVAAQNLLHYKGSVGSVRSRIHDVEIEGFATKLVVTYHPSYLLRDPSQKKESWKDLQMVMRYLGLPIPASAV
jgi:uracil-DNA glycosylase family 4